MIGMARYPDKHFDLAICDPPYGLPKDSSNGRGKLKNRTFNMGGISDKWDIAPDKLYFNELFRVSKNQIIWGGNYFSLPPSRGFCVWDKKQPWPNFSRCEYAWLSMQVPSKIFEFDNRTTDKIHPTQKPIALYDWLIQHYAKDCKNILDTHVGSGSSRIAAHKHGKEFIGFEIDKGYWDAQEKRYQQFIAQGTLF